MWFVFLWPTLVIAADFLYMSAFTKNAVVDTVHFSAQLLWVIGNSVWAMGEFFFEGYDEPLIMWVSSDEAFRTARWYSSWILFSAFFPIILMYMVWVPLTYSGLLSVQHKHHPDVPYQKLLDDNDDDGDAVRRRGRGGAIDETDEESLLDEDDERFESDNLLPRREVAWSRVLL